jgi:hypothetical protein
MATQVSTSSAAAAPQPTAVNSNEVATFFRAKNYLVLTFQKLAKETNNPAYSALADVVRRVDRTYVVPYLNALQVALEASPLVRSGVEANKQICEMYASACSASSQSAEGEHEKNPRFFSVKNTLALEIFRLLPRGEKAVEADLQGALERLAECVTPKAFIQFWENWESLKKEPIAQLFKAKTFVIIASRALRFYTKDQGYSRYEEGVVNIHTREEVIPLLRELETIFNSSSIEDSKKQAYLEKCRAQIASCSSVSILKSGAVEESDRLFAEKAKIAEEMHARLAKTAKEDHPQLKKLSDQLAVCATSEEVIAFGNEWNRFLNEKAGERPSKKHALETSDASEKNEERHVRPKISARSSSAAARAATTAAAATSTDNLPH